MYPSNLKLIENIIINFMTVILRFYVQISKFLWWFWNLLTRIVWWGSASTVSDYYNICLTVSVDYRSIFRPCSLEKFNVQADLNQNVGLLRVFPSIQTNVVSRNNKWHRLFSNRGGLIQKQVSTYFLNNLIAIMFMLFIYLLSSFEPSYI